MNRILPISLLLMPLMPLAAVLQAQGSTIQAASCSQADVQKAVSGATDGDIIQIPAGTCTWNAGIVVPVGIGITIEGSGTPNSTPVTFGAGTTNTTIIDGMSKSSGGNVPLITMQPKYGNSLSRVSTLQIEPGSGASPWSPVVFWGTCTSSGCPSIRFDNVKFPSSWAADASSLQDGQLLLINDDWGVVDHNTVLGTDSQGYGFINESDGEWLGVGQYGDNSWASPDTLGTAQTLYIENNEIDTNLMVIDCDTGPAFQNEGGCRYVGRFNHIVDPSATGIFVNHGTETTGRPRGGRQAEVYNNAVTCVNTKQGCNAVGGFRSGVVYVFDNSVTVNSGSWLNAFMNLNAYRTFSGFTSYGFCDGEGPYDDNDGVTYASGTITALSTTNGVLTVTDGSKSWSSSQWVDNGAPYSIIDESVNTPTGAYSFHPGYEIDSSTANSVSASGYGADYWNGPPSFNVGDTYAIKRATVCLDQPSRSGGTLLSGDPPSPTGWVNESLDPSYEWGDVDESGNPNHGPVTTSTLRLIADRDYYGEVSMSANTSPTSPFNGTTGTGFGTLANRPTTCKTGVAYWATDQGSWNQSGSGQQGELFKCTAANTWTLAYTPYTYPHPLINSDAFSASSARPAAPTNLSGSVQ